MNRTNAHTSGTPRWPAVLAAILLLSIIGIAAWNSSALRPNDAALAALESDSSVTVTVRDDLIKFEPAGAEAKTALVFYPGGKVDFRAYAPALRMIAAHGYAVFAPSMPLYLAFFDADAASEIIAAHPEISTWVIGGHSLGGVAASSYAAGRAEEISGIVFWASYPANAALKQAQTPVLSLYGTLDGLSSVQEVDASRADLPSDAQFVAIEGGNHAQFGAYGPQAGDNAAAISPESQWLQAAEATAAYLSSLEP